MVDQHFIDVYRKAKYVSEKNGGLFDVTVGPLINARRFGFSHKAIVDISMIDILLRDFGYKILFVLRIKQVKL